MKAALLATAIFLTTTQAYAFDCADIRAIVKSMGEKKAIQFARSAGATDEQIKQARECLKTRGTN